MLTNEVFVFKWTHHDADINPVKSIYIFTEPN